MGFFQSLAKDWKKPIENRPMWNGEVNKRVVLWREQGIGDDILFMGLLLEASKITKSLTVYTLKRLIPLCKRGMPGIKFKLKLYARHSSFAQRNKAF